jgi:hypothetical protein
MRELLLANLLETILLFEPMRSHAKLSEAPLDGFLTRMPEVEIFPSPPVFSPSCAGFSDTRAPTSPRLTRMYGKTV